MRNKNLITKFWEINERNKFGSSTIALYFYLLEIYTKKRDKFSISDRQLKEVLGISRNTIKSCRTELLNSKLIKCDFNKGISTIYELLKEDDLEKTITLKEDNEEKDISVVFEDLVPPFDEFLDFAKSLVNYKPSLDEIIKIKYEEWKKNGWKTKQGRPITDYKSNLKAILPFLEKEIENISIPNINRPN